LRTLSRSLAHPLDAVEVARCVHGALQQAVDAPICFYGAYDPLAQCVTVIWQVDHGQELPGGQFPLGSGVTSQVLRTRQAQLIRRWSAHAPAVQVQYATERPDLPESAMVVPVIFDDQVLGVFSVQSYTPEAFDEDNLRLLQDCADLAALALSGSARRPPPRRSSEVAAGSSAELEALVASLPDGVLVLDTQGRLVRLNQAARRLLCLDNTSLVLGHPVDRPQAGHWPLGTAALTEQLRPLVDRLKRGENPEQHVEVTLAGGAERVASCRGAVVLRGGQPAGGVLTLHELASSARS
jgi:PAS domain-containing protein